MTTSLTRDQLKIKLRELDIPHRSNDSKMILLKLLSGELQPTPLRSPKKKIVSPSPSTKTSSPTHVYENLLSLPQDVLLESALNLDNESLMNLCLTNKKAYNKICANDDFWRKKCVKEERVSPPDYQGTWKNLYENYRNIYIMGNNPGTVHAEVGIFKNQFSNNLHIKSFEKPTTLYEKFNLLPIYGKKILSMPYYFTIMDPTNKIINYGNAERRKILLELENKQVKDLYFLDNHTAYIDMNDDVYITSFPFLQGFEKISEDLYKIPNIKAKNYMVIFKPYTSLIWIMIFGG
jgi:hypothetical protein